MIKVLSWNNTVLDMISKYGNKVVQREYADHDVVKVPVEFLRVNKSGLFVPCLISSPRVANPILLKDFEYPNIQAHVMELTAAQFTEWWQTETYNYSYINVMGNKGVTVSYCSHDANMPKYLDDKFQTRFAQNDTGFTQKDVLVMFLMAMQSLPLAGRARQMKYMESRIPATTMQSPIGKMTSVFMLEMGARRGFKGPMLTDDQYLRLAEDWSHARNINEKGHIDCDFN